MQDIGCAIGSLVTFFWGESIGRKRMIMAGAATMLVGTVRPLLILNTARAYQLYSGDSHELYHTDSTIRWANRYRNRKRTTAILFS